MEKKKTKRKSQIQDRILTLLAIASEALDVVGDFTYNPYPYVYKSLGVSHTKESLKRGIQELIKKGLVEGNKDDGLRLTSAGAEVKQRLLRARSEDWDGKWRAVFFDIPEVQRDLRDNLRFELKKLGFGLWQRSVWITPFDIGKELGSYLRKEKISNFVEILVGERVGDLSDREFAARVWPLDKVNEGYKDLLGGWVEELKKESSAEERLLVAISFHSRYLILLEDDPRLPLELLPDDWIGAEAEKLFGKLKSTLTVSRIS